MAHALASSATFVGVSLMAALVTAAGLQFTLAQISAAAARVPVNTSMRASYVSTLAVAEPEALNIAKATVVKPVTPAAAELPAAIADGFTHTVAVESLRVRSGPNKTTAQILALKGGTRVKAVRQENGWIMVDAGEGRVGWVYHRFLKPIPPGNQPGAEL